MGHGLLANCFSLDQSVCFVEERAELLEQSTSIVLAGDVVQFSGESIEPRDDFLKSGQCIRHH